MGKGRNPNRKNRAVMKATHLGDKGKGKVIHVFN